MFFTKHNINDLKVFRLAIEWNNNSHHCNLINKVYSYYWDLGDYFIK